MIRGTLLLVIGFTIGIYATDRASIPAGVLVEAGKLAGWSYVLGCVSHTPKEMHKVCAVDSVGFTSNLIDLLLLKKR